MASNDKNKKKPKQIKPDPAVFMPGKTRVPIDQDGQPGKTAPAREQTLLQTDGARQPQRGGKQK